MEQLKNLSSTTLASSYTAGAGSISVTSAASFPTGGTFSVTILDQTTGAVKLIFRVTSVSGTTFTGAAEGSDANASSGDIVVGSMITVAALSQIAADLNGYGTIASRPSSPQLVGARYVASDSVFDEARWNGTSWDQFISGMLCTPPSTGSPATFPTAAHGSNGAENSFAAANDAVLWGVHASSGNNLVVRVGAYPSTPFRKRLRVRHMTQADSFEHVGICFYDSGSGKALSWGLGIRQAPGVVLVGYEWSDLSSPSNYVNRYAIPLTFRGGVFEIWAEDDGTNRNWYFCVDGQNGQKVLQESNTNFLTPDGLGIAVLPYTQTFSPSELVTILDWSDV